MARNASFAAAASGGAVIGSATATFFFWLLSVFIGRPFALSAVVFLFVDALLIVMAIVFTLGLAWHLFARARGWSGATAYVAPAAIGGLLLGCAIALFLALWARDDGVSTPPFMDIAAVIGYCVSGAVTTALAAWLIRRPDRDANPSTEAP